MPNIIKNRYAGKSPDVESARAETRRRQQEEEARRRAEEEARRTEEEARRQQEEADRRAEEERARTEAARRSTMESYNAGKNRVIDALTGFGNKLNNAGEQLKQKAEQAEQNKPAEATASEWKAPETKAARATERQRLETERAAVQADYDEKKWIFDMGQMGPGSQAQADELLALEGQLDDYDRKLRALEKNVEWEGRGALLAEYKQLERKLAVEAGLSSEEDIARFEEVKRLLKEGDEAAGNAEQYFTAGDRIGGAITGATKNIGAGLLNGATTVLNALAQGQAMSYSPTQATVDALTGVDPYGRAAQGQAQAAEVNKTLEPFYQTADNLGASAAKDIEMAKGGLGKFGQAGIDIVDNFVGMGFDAGMAFITGGSALVPMFMRSAGSAMQEARLAGGDMFEQLSYGLTEAGIQVATERMFDGLSGLYGKGTADQLTNELVNKLTSSTTGRAVLRLIAGAEGEGVEEIVGAMLEPFAKGIYDDEAIQNFLDNGWDLGDLLYDYLLGTAVGILGGASGAVNEIAGANTGADTGTPMTEQVQQEEANPLAEAALAAEQEQIAQQQAADEMADILTNPMQEAQEEAQAQEGIPVPPEEQTSDTEPVEEFNATPQMQEPVVPKPGMAGPTVEATGAEKERGMAETARNDEGTEEKLKQSLGDDLVTYRQLASKDVLAKAQEIYDGGFDQAKTTVDNAIHDAHGGKKLSPVIVPLSRMVANELTRQGNVEEAHRIIADVAAELTAAGQLGNAAKILNSQGNNPDAVMQTVEKMLGQINEEYAKHKHVGKDADWTAELTPEELKLIEETDFTEEGAFEDVWNTIARRLGAEMPATVWEKLNEFRRVNMLLRPRTQIKNFLANVPMLGMRKLAEKMSGAWQDAKVKAGKMNAEDQTRTAHISGEARTLAKSWFKANKDYVLNEGNKFDMNRTLREYRTYFKDGAISKALSEMSGKEVHNWLETRRKLTYQLLQQGDAPFVQNAFEENLAQYCSAHGITSADGITQDAIDFAMANAMEATYKAENALAQTLNKLKKNPRLGKAVDILIPFTTTPANVFEQTINYSPLGFAKALSEKLQGAPLSEQIDTASRATVGTGIFALGMILRSMGLITGPKDDNKKAAQLDKATGNSPFSVGGAWDYSWAQPAGSILALGAEVADGFAGLKGDDDNTALDKLFNAAFAYGDSLFNMSMMQNVTNLLEGYGSPTEKALKSVISGLGTQLVPGLIADIAKITDNTARSTYTGGNIMDDTLAKMQTMIPGLSDKLPAQVDVLGRDVSRGDLLTSTINALVNPGNMNLGKPTPESELAKGVYEATGGDSSVLPPIAPYNLDGTTLSGKEREAWQRASGTTWSETVNALVDNEAFQNADTETQTYVLGQIGEYSNYVAKKEFLGNKGEEFAQSKWEKLGPVMDSGVDLADYLLGKREANEDGQGSVKVGELVDWLANSDYNAEQKEAIWNANYNGEKTYDEYYNSLPQTALTKDGMSQEEADEFVAAVDATGKEDGKLTQDELKAYYKEHPEDEDKVAAIWNNQYSKEWKTPAAGKMEPKDVLLSEGVESDKADEIVSALLGDDNKLQQTDFAAYYKEHPDEEEKLRKIWEGRGYKTPFDKIVKKNAG